MGASSAVIEAPCSVVWDVLYDVDAMLQWQPDVKEAACLKRDAKDRPLLVRTVLDTVIARAEATLWISYSDPGVMRWEKQSGNVPGFIGSWTVKPMGEARTSVEYRLRLDFGDPGKLIRGPLAGTLNAAQGSSMPDKLKAYVEARYNAQPAPSETRRTRGRVPRMPLGRSPRQP